MSTLDSPLRRAVGDKTAKALAKHLDLNTVGDLLYHFPRRYEQRGEHTDIRALAVGDDVTILAQVQRVHRRKIRQGTDEMLEVEVGDNKGGELQLTFFGRKQM